MILLDDNNESNDFVDTTSKDDVDVYEDALTNDIILGSIPAVVAFTPYTLVSPLYEHVEDKS